MDLKSTLNLLRQNFDLELDNTLALTQDEHQSVFSCYDRALTNTLLHLVSGGTAATPQPQAQPRPSGGPKPGSKEARDRAAKAQQTRAANKVKAQQEEQARLASIDAAKTSNAHTQEGQEGDAGGAA